MSGARTVQAGGIKCGSVQSPLPFVSHSDSWQPTGFHGLAGFGWHSCTFTARVLRVLGMLKASYIGVLHGCTMYVWMFFRRTHRLRTNLLCKSGIVW